LIRFHKNKYETAIEFLIKNFFEARSYRMLRKFFTCKGHQMFTKTVTQTTTTYSSNNAVDANAQQFPPHVCPTMSIMHNPYGAAQMSVGAACKTIGTYMQQNDIKAVSIQDLQTFANDKNVSPLMRNACTCMLQNRDEWKKVETRDTHGRAADNYSSGSNFLGRARDLGASNYQPVFTPAFSWGSYGPLPTMPDGRPMLTESNPGETYNMSEGDACRAIGAYLKKHNIKSVKIGDLQKMANDQDLSSRMRDACSWMLQHPKEWEKIETLDTSSYFADDKSGVSNFLDRANALGVRG
jgi:hypothetical protein